MDLPKGYTNEEPAYKHNLSNLSKEIAIQSLQDNLSNLYCEYSDFDRELQFLLNSDKKLCSFIYHFEINSEQESAQQLSSRVGIINGCQIGYVPSFSKHRGISSWTEINYSWCLLGKIFNFALYEYAHILKSTEHNSFWGNFVVRPMRERVFFCKCYDQTAEVQSLYTLEGGKVIPQVEELLSSEFPKDDDLVFVREVENEVFFFDFQEYHRGIIVFATVIVSFILYTGLGGKFDASGRYFNVVLTGQLLHIFEGIISNFEKSVTLQINDVLRFKGVFLDDEIYAQILNRYGVEIFSNEHFAESNPDAILFQKQMQELTADIAKTVYNINAGKLGSPL